MRTFKFADDDSYKFWKIELEGSSYTVTYGRIGTKGQTSTKSFASPEKAKAAYEKIIAEKLGKGYKETTPVLAAPKVEDALEKALVDNPYDIAASAAYADRLSQQGDPRGEFIQVQLQLEDPTIVAENRKKLQAREKELLDAHAKTWLGGLAEHLLDQPAAPSWRQSGGRKFAFFRGWLDSIVADSLTVNFARALVKAPEIRMLSELRIEYVAYEEAGEFEAGSDIGENEQSPQLAALQRLPVLPNLRIFYLGEPDESGTHIDGEPACDLVERMPNLEELHLQAHRVDLKRLFGMSLPKLRILQLDACLRHPLEVLAQNPAMANLTHLFCWPHAMEYDDEEQGAYIRLAGARAVFRSPHLKKLAHLRLRLSDMGDAGIKEIVESGALKRLKSLDLYGGVVTNVGANLLATSPDIKNLESLDLSMNQLTNEGIAALEATGVKLVAKDQYGEGDDEYLFMGDME
jgi:uncharacterized protein (TIGR02996 family)